MNKTNIEEIEKGVNKISLIIEVLEVYCEYNKNESATIPLLPILEVMKGEITKMEDLLENA